MEPINNIEPINYSPLTPQSIHNTHDLVLWTIFINSSKINDLLNCRLVCKRWKKIASYNLVWDEWFKKNKTFPQVKSSKTRSTFHSYIEYIRNRKKLKWRIWDKRTGKDGIVTVCEYPQYPFLRGKDGHEGPITKVQIIGDTLISSACDRTIRLWDLNTRKCYRILDHQRLNVRDFIAESGRITSYAEDLVYVWHQDTLD